MECFSPRACWENLRTWLPVPLDGVFQPQSMLGKSKDVVRLSPGSTTEPGWVDSEGFLYIPAGEGLC